MAGTSEHEISDYSYFDDFDDMIYSKTTKIL